MEGVYLDDAILRDTKVQNVQGLTREQIEDLEARGAIIDATTRANAPQAVVLPPMQSTNIQAPSVPSTQTSSPSSDKNVSSASVAQHDVVQISTVTPTQVVVLPANTDSGNAAAQQNLDPSG